MIGSEELACAFGHIALLRVCLGGTTSQWYSAMKTKRRDQIYNASRNFKLLSRIHAFSFLS